MTAYRFTIGEPISECTQCVQLEWNDIDSHGYKVTSRCAVWVTDGRGRCSTCSGPLVAMSGSCGHVRAALRYLKRKQAAQ
jgi:hypothetical protein